MHVFGVERLQLQVRQ